MGRCAPFRLPAYCDPNGQPLKVGAQSAQDNPGGIMEPKPASASSHAPMSRRTFVKTATIAGVSIAVMGLAGCAPAAKSDQQAGYAAGTYTAAA